MELTQTLNQKETAQLLSGFLGNLKSHEKPILIYETTGVKLDKPLFMDIHEGSFTPKTLLKKYPLSDNQMMFIFVLSKHYVYKKGLGGFEPCFKVTGLTTKGHIITTHTRNNNILDIPYSSVPYGMFKNKEDFNKERNIAKKTLIVISDKNNIVSVGMRHTYRDLDYEILSYEGEKPLEAKITCVYKGKSDISRVIIRGRDKHKVGTVRINSDYFFVDSSGYNTEYFKQRLFDELNKRNNIKIVNELVSTDYTSDINKLLDEIVSLKNMALVELINITNETDIAHRLFSCVKLSYYVIDDIQELIDDLKRIREEYNNGGIEHSIHMTPELVKYNLKTIMKSISNIKQKLFDELKQSDI
jgi:hypothetical protein